MKYWFLASPYSKYPWGLNAAAEMAALNRAILIRAGVKVFSPVVHSHWVAKIGGLDPLSHEIWMEAEAPFRHHAHGLIFLLLTGHKESVGMRQELEEFTAARKPLVLMTPGQLPKEFADGPHE